MDTTVHSPPFDANKNGLGEAATTSSPPPVKDPAPNPISVLVGKERIEIMEHRLASIQAELRQKDDIIARLEEENGALQRERQRWMLELQKAGSH